ncbi:unnamed protein product [Cuscuta epithymum]|uniref:rRNA-processing protein EBP2 homolog n=1 Tax=Cuscuta epithymum TaxID=186058 RepID=A0AAV0ENY9_9ASTE|nr:unnamed protein product [Cuscuta epithymum]
MDIEMENPEEETEVESGSEEEDDDPAVKLAEPSKDAVYNKNGLLDKLGDISWPEKVDWIHRLSFDIDKEGEEVDVNDDLARELAFYTQALQGTREAYLKFQSAGLPFLRPSDYYAEMVKSDVHMEKVKGRLLSEKKRIEEAEERKKARENKKIAKEMQAQKLKERAQQKKHDIESVKQWRKQRQQSGFDKDAKAELDLDFEDGNGKVFQRSGKNRPGVAPGDRSGGKGRFGSGNTKKGGFDKKPKGREFKNSKFGFGGQKGGKKQNTADSTNDFRSFNKNRDSSGGKRRRVK